MHTHYTLTLTLCFLLQIFSFVYTYILIGSIINFGCKSLCNRTRTTFTVRLKRIGFVLAAAVVVAIVYTFYSLMYLCEFAQCNLRIEFHLKVF